MPLPTSEVEGVDSDATGSALQVADAAAVARPQHRASPSSSTTSTRVNSPLSNTVGLDTVPPATSLEGTTGPDLEHLPQPPKVLDIEHLLVKDDPRMWSSRKKSSVLAVIAVTAMGGTITANIFFPALQSLQEDLQATDGLLSATVSLFILGQGVFPCIWSGISEISGRRKCYISALCIYIASTAVCSRANTIGLFLGMRIIQSIGASAVLSLGAGTLADIYDVHERGTKLGLFYGVPLLGPSLGPLVGGALTSKFTWRSTFYFLLSYGVVCLAMMIWLPETFRKERSMAWQLAMQRAQKHAKEDLIKAKKELPVESLGRTQAKTAFAAPSPSQLERNVPTFPLMNRIVTGLSLRSGEDHVKIHFRDVNPFAAVGVVCAQRHNVIALTYSGLLFASQYSITFSASRTFSAAPFSYGSLIVGLILLSFGVGNMIGSLGGGRYSDRVFIRLKGKNGGVGEPEMRIKSAYIGLMAMPPLLIAYAWVVQEQAHVAAPVVVLFWLGLATIWIYSSTLAFVVDSNPGRASSAIACNSLFRGVLAAAASQAAEPIINAIGNGWYYTAFAFLLAIGELGLLVVCRKGKGWREAARNNEAGHGGEGQDDGEKTAGDGRNGVKSLLPWRK